MEVRTVSKKNKRIPILPIGDSVAPDQGPCSTLNKQLEFGSEGGVPLQRKDKVWYVLLTCAIHPAPGSFEITKIQHTWIWAHTKSWARELGDRAQREGFTVIDIFPGTKAHVNAKFRGLK